MLKGFHFPNFFILHLLLLSEQFKGQYKVGPKRFLRKIRKVSRNSKFTNEKQSFYRCPLSVRSEIFGSPLRRKILTDSKRVLVSSLTKLVVNQDVQSFNESPDRQDPFPKTSVLCGQKISSCPWSGGAGSESKVNAHLWVWRLFGDLRVLRLCDAMTFQF